MAINISKNPYATSHRRWTSKEVKKMYELKEQGFTMRDISKKLNRSYTATLQKWRKCKPVVVSKPTATPPEIIKVQKQTLKSMELDVKGIKIHMVFS